ncbi:hypothetical protein OG21DRAFT_911410 [Imleria badia]|nr:hypothetical protein OG21DRAFT_911410 [Imleria badia]
MSLPRNPRLATESLAQQGYRAIEMRGTELEGVVNSITRTDWPSHIPRVSVMTTVGFPSNERARAACGGYRDYLGRFIRNFCTSFISEHSRHSCSN